MEIDETPLDERVEDLQIEMEFSIKKILGIKQLASIIQLEDKKDAEIW